MKAQPILGVDIDETIADLLTPWLMRYNREYNDTLLPENLTEWNMVKAVKEECGPRIYNFLTPDIYDEITPLPGARTAIKLFREWGIRVVFITSCTRNTTDAKLNWLFRWGFLDGSRRFQPDYIPASDKSLIRADALLDDKLENVEEFPGMAWLISQPQNAFVSTSRIRLKSIQDAPAAVAEWLNSPYRR